MINFLMAFVDTDSYGFHFCNLENIQAFIIKYQYMYMFQTSEVKLSGINLKCIIMNQQY